jgi:hypothetical protein
MLYLLELEKDLDIHPKFFGKHLREIIHEKLVHEVCAVSFTWNSSQPALHLQLGPINTASSMRRLFLLCLYTLFTISMDQDVCQLSASACSCLVL